MVEYGVPGTSASSFLFPCRLSSVDVVRPDRRARRDRLRLKDRLSLAVRAAPWEPEDRCNSLTGDSQEMEQGADRDPDIEPKAHPFHIIEVVIQLATDTIEIRIGGLEHLDKPGEAGTNLKAAGIVGQCASELVGDFGTLRTGTD